MPLIPWKVSASRYLIRDRWLTLRADRCETARGVVLDPYYVLEPRDWVQVVAFDADDRILINRQYRHGLGAISTELPCGTVEPGETPIDAMRRELLEETGCVTESLELLNVFSPNPSLYTNRVHFFVATGTKRIQAQALDPAEDIEFQFLSGAEIFALIDQGRFPQALHVACLLLALRARGDIPKNR